MTSAPINVDSQRQLFIDDLWFDRQENIKLTMHRPEAREIALQADRPWEERGVHCFCVLQDGDRFRMWYRGAEGALDGERPDRTWQCYAESNDGITWEKPTLGLVERAGSRDNNILFPSESLGRNASVILDPNAPVNERYKMVTRDDGHLNALYGYVSADGYQWQPVAANPVLTEGPFDSPNTLVWDDERKRYVIFMRGKDESVTGAFFGGRRAIRRSESVDFQQWTPPEMLIAADNEDPSNMHFYTNAAVKYNRAERAWFMFPMCFYPDRHYPTSPAPGVSDVRLSVNGWIAIHLLVQA
ncbi:hypothetical protein KFU94_13915 [Chloroflexi bacterium TSY]|nr:hypothetical protein [Chloroflexi bacterium TSY]